MAELGYALYDADNHYYEPSDCYTRHIEPAFADQALRVVEQPDGTSRVQAGDRPFTFLLDPFRTTTSKPGSLRAMLRAMKAGTAARGEDATRDHIEPIQPAYVDRDARLALMDEQGIEATLLFPTLGVCVEQLMSDRPEQLYANLRAFNRWLDDDWGFAHRDRIFATPLLNLTDLDQAVAELEWALDRGARAIAMRPGPATYGRSPADTHYDPFWARVQEAGVPVCFHIAESGYNAMFSVAWGEEAAPSSHQQSAFQWTCTYGDRPIMDTIASMVFWNLFGRFPGLQIISVENGSLWVPYLLAAMDKMKGMGRNGPWPGGYVPGRPSEVVRQHLFVSPYHEEDIVDLAERIGVSQVLFGSDYPHAEGLAEPASFAESLDRLPDDDVRRVMADNLRSLLRLPAAAA